MSPSDVTMPLISAPWLNAEGNPLSVVPLPGLRSEVIQNLECSHPGILSRPMKNLLGSCCGLAGTELGSIDFTGCWFMEEPYPVFRPALTLAIDDAERRWIAEVGNQDLPGPIWCVLPDPEVAAYVCDDLSAFLRTLHDRTSRGEVGAWLQNLTAQARAIWSRRHALALRPYEAHRSDRTIRGWLMTLPSDAYVYDLHTQTDTRGWPYGVGGPSSRLYRCGRELVFAVAGLPAQGWRAPHPRARVSNPAHAAAGAEVSSVIGSARGGRKPLADPKRPVRWASGRRTAARLSFPRSRRIESAAAAMSSAAGVARSCAA